MRRSLWVDNDDDDDEEELRIHDSIWHLMRCKKIFKIEEDIDIQKRANKITR